METFIHQFFQQLINGVSLGSIYALIALGYTMIYGIIKLINFAHGDITQLGLPFIPAILFSMAGAAIAGIIIERVAYRPMRNAPRIAILITAIGVSFFLEYSMILLVSPQPRTFPAVFGATVYHLGPLVANSQQLVILLSAIILMAVLTYIVNKTKAGKAMRAVSYDADAARLMGINIDQISIIRKTVLRRNPILLANGFELFLINVANGHQGQIGTLGNTGLVHAAPDGSYAYRSYANNFLFYVDYNSFKLSYKLNKINLFFPESLQRREELPPRWHSESLQRSFHLINRGRDFPTTCSFGDNLCC